MRIIYAAAVALFLTACGGGGGGEVQSIGGVFNGTVQEGSGPAVPVTALISENGVFFAYAPDSGLIYTSFTLKSSGDRVSGGVRKFIPEAENDAIAPADNQTQFARYSRKGGGPISGTASEQEWIEASFNGTDNTGSAIDDQFVLEFDADAYLRPSDIASLHPSAWESCDSQGRKSRIVFSADRSDGKFTGVYYAGNNISCAHSGTFNVVDPDYSVYVVNGFIGSCPSPTDTVFGAGAAIFVDAQGDEPEKMIIGLSYRDHAGVATFTSAPLDVADPDCD